MKNKKPIGYFTKLLAFDCETSAISRTNKRNPAENCQAVSWALIVLNSDTLKEIDRLYVEIKWDGISNWSPEAQKVHGLSKEYLEKNGISDEQAIIEIANFILKYWPMNTRIHTLGHNQIGFDIPFMRTLFEKFDMQINFANRHIDTFTLMHTFLNAFNSEDGFKKIGLKKRTTHNAMEDIEMTINVVRRLKLLWKAKVGL